MTNHLKDLLTLFEGAPTGMILLSGDYSPEYWNSAAAALLAPLTSRAASFHLAEPREPYRLDIQQRTSPEPSEPVSGQPNVSWLASELEDFARSDAPEQSFEKIVDFNRTRHHFLVTLRRRQAEDGRAQGAAVFISDLTQQRQSQEALHAFEEKCQAYLNNPFEGILITDTLGKVLEGNDKMAELLDCRVAELSRLDLSRIYPAEKLSENLASFQDIVQKGAGTQANQLLQRPDGTTLPVDVDIGVMHFAGRTLVRCIFRDISLRQRRETEQLRLGKLESLGRLAGSIAHDFNNILTAILGNITLVMLDNDLKAFCQERLHEAEKACLRAQGLTQQLLAFAKGGQPLKKRLSLLPLVHQVLDDLLLGFKSRVEVDIPSDLCSLDADPSQLKQALANLLINADQAMPGGGVIQLGAENVQQEPENGTVIPPGRYVRISIGDQGPGIPPEHLPQIFDPYFTTKDMRHGLGLAMVHAIVKNHAGFITIDTQPGVGTSFYIYLPAQADSSQLPQEILPLPVTGEGRILLMDDEAIIRDIVSRMLIKLGYEVDTAVHGADAIALYQEALHSDRPYAAVVFDLTIVGGMGGKEALEELRRLDPDVKAIVSSGYSDDPIMADHLRYGFRGVLAKPYKLVELSRVLKEVIS